LFEDDTNAFFCSSQSAVYWSWLFSAHNKSPNYDFVYDQVVSYGELISTTILTHYESYGYKLRLMLKLHKTDSNYRDATVDWDLTHKNISKNEKTWTLPRIPVLMKIISTTLGREGSDYTAQFCLLLECWQRHHLERCSWVMNPRYFENASLLNQTLSWGYWIAFYGATVIHPKHYNPYRKEIPLYKVLINPGTSVSRGVNLEPYLPCFIVKRNQLLISLVYWLFLYYGRKHQWNIIPWV
jgi:aspartate kinase